jgi:hypothetical protein
MKHIVKLTLSNPSHEHVSMRMRTKQQDYITEGRDESEAINRAARHFQSLGFKVHSAVIVEQKVEIPEVNAEPVSLSEAVDYKALEKPTVARVKSGETKLPPRTNYDIPPAMRKKVVDKKAALEAFIARRKETVTEETAPQYIEEKLSAADPASKWIHDFVHSDNPKFAGKSKEERIRMALGAKYAAGMAEEVEQIEEGDLSVRTLYNKFADAHVNGHDTNSTEKVIRKVHGDEVMNHMKKAAKANAKADIDGEERHFDNAQTAAKKTDRIGGTVGRGRSEFMRKRREWSEEFEQVEEKYENNPLHSMPRPNKAVGLKPSQLAKKPVTAEAADPGETKVVNKAVKTKKASAAADRMVKIAKSKVNKINMDPKLDNDVKQSSRY